MLYCEKCGTQIPEAIDYCPNCGAKVGSAASNEKKNDKDDFMSKVAAINDTNDTTGEYDVNDINNNKVMAVLSYFGILVLIPILAAKESKFARFHANQGLLLLITEAILGFAQGILRSIFSGPIYFLISTAVNLGLLALFIIGLVNSINGKAKELPIIGKYKLIK